MVRIELRILTAVCISLIAASGKTALSQDITRIEAFQTTMHLLREVPISTEVTGTLVNVTPNDEGVFVKKGDLLIELNDSVIQADVKHAQAQATQETEIVFARVSLAAEEENFSQKQSANERRPGAFSPPEMRTAKLLVDKAHAQLNKSLDEQILYQLSAKIKEAQLAQYKVMAPFDGCVTTITRFPGQNVRQGDPVLTLTDMSELEARVKVSFKFRNLLYVGDDVEIQVIASGEIDVPPGDPIGDEPQSKGNSIFERSGPNAEGAVEPLVATRAAAANDDDLFIGKIKFIEPRIHQEGGHAYVSLSVGVPNRQDKYGRFLLQEGMPVKATVLSKKRPE